MKINEFKKRCNVWRYRTWNKGNLIDYWKQSGLTVEQILKNKEKLHGKTKTIAILGSVGKTTLSRVLFNIIKQGGYSCYLTKVNDNWLPQLPFAVDFALKENADISIFECGVASKGDTTLMAHVVPAKIIVYTEFAEVNLLELNSLLGISKEKKEFALKNPHAKIVSHINNKPCLEKEDIQDIIYYGKLGSSAKFNYKMEDITESSTNIRILGDNELVLNVNDVGLHLGSACCGAVAAYSEIIDGGLKDVTFLELDSYNNPKQRMQRLDYHGTKLIIDIANSNELSILNSLETIIKMDTCVPKNAVIGEIYGLGDKSEKIMQRVIDQICNLGLDGFNTLHFIGEHFFHHQEEIRKKIDTIIQFYLNEGEFKARFNIEDYKGQMVLLRGPTKGGINISNMLKGYDSSSEETSPSELKSFN